MSAGIGANSVSTTMTPLCSSFVSKCLEEHFNTVAMAATFEVEELFAEPPPHPSKHRLKEMILKKTAKFLYFDSL